MPRLVILAIFAFALSGGEASAATFDWVTVGDASNACDPQPQGCFGAVPYTYRISRTEVTNTQYAEFLNAVADADPNGLWNNPMAGTELGGIVRSGSPGSFTYTVKNGYAQMPANNMSPWSAIRFANWLHNGQPVGPQDASTTEDGAYTLTAQGMADNSITRNAGATVFLASEDEWYKAAYYDASSSSFFDFPLGSDAIPTCSLPTAAPNTANCGQAVGLQVAVGSYPGSPSPAGTFDQAGNVWEWNDTIIDGSERGRRGGAWSQPGEFGALQSAASLRASDPPTEDAGTIGFRIASVPDHADDACANGIDDDLDGAVDGADAGCSDPADTSERDPAFPCDDTDDDDADGADAFPDDPGCSGPGDASERDAAYACDDEVDGDGDGSAAYPQDAGCSAPVDPTETDSALPCDDGSDDDGDGFGDFPADPGCLDSRWPLEDPQCQNGVNDDGQAGIDFDGGASVNGGVPIAAPDAGCMGLPYRNTEKTGCGLGFELAPLLLGLGALRRRRRA